MSNEEVEKKPIYKKWWFWLIIVVVIAGIGSSQTQETSTSIQNTTSNNVVSDTVAEKKEVTIIDFSQMEKEDIQNWCTTNNVICDITEEYSDSITKGAFISQSTQANSIIYEGDEITIVYSLGKEPTMGEKNALDSANNYLRFMSFSYTGLIEQLEYEGYTNQEATYAVDNCGADWNEQAAKKAEEYINTMSFSRNGLIEQLEYEGFTSEQSEYGVSAVGY